MARALRPLDLLTWALWLALGTLAACGAGGARTSAPGNPPPPPPPGPATGLAVGLYADLRVDPGLAAGEVWLRFRAPPAGPGPVTAYEVRAQVRHLTPENLPAAPVVPQAHAPQAPGTAESLRLAGLEPGQTLQFAVRALYGTEAGPYSYPVAGRVPGGAPPALPPDAIPLTGPATLDREGATYVLRADVTCPGTAFFIAARDVTLDLGGRTVTYGTQPGSTPGVYSEYLYGSGRTRIFNGTLRQGAGNGNAPAVELRGGHDVEIAYLDVTVQGPDSDGLRIWDQPSGDLSIHHNTVRCNTQQVSDRHFPGVAAIWLGGVTGACHLHHNRILAAPQWGIKVEGSQSRGPFDVHHNVVTGTRSRVANAYMLGIHKPDAYVFENLLAGESRGIHLDGEYHSGRNARVHDNRIVAQDRPNAEYPQHWCHGIKVEVSAGSHLWHNRVDARGDAEHAAAYALDLGLGPASNTTVERNCFVAVSDTPLFEGRALNWTYGAAPGPSRLVCRHNVFRASHRLIFRDWSPALGGALEACAFAREATPGAGGVFSFEHFATSDQGTNLGHRLQDPITREDDRAVTQWASPGPYETTRERTLSVRVTDGAGLPRAGVAVRVRDRAGTLVGSAATDAAGRVALRLVTERIRNGPSVDARGPFGVDVDGGAYATQADLAAARALLVSLGEPATGVWDAEPPPAPGPVGALAASASRVVAWWPEPPDAAGVAAYLVYADGELLAVRTTPEAVISGLDPDRDVRIEVEALDHGGNRSPRSDPVTVRTRPEDRGP